MTCLLLYPDPCSSEVCYNGVEVYMSRAIRKPAFAYVKTKLQISCVVTPQVISALFSLPEDSTIPLLSKSEISSLWPSSVAVQPDLYWSWSVTPKTGFLMTRLIRYRHIDVTYSYLLHHR